MRFINLLLKGLIVGVAGVAPGVSVSVFLVLMGIYDDTIEAIGGLLTNRGRIKSYLSFLLPVGVGVAGGVIAFARLATFVLDQYPVPTQFFFIGTIVGSIPSVIRMHHDLKPSVPRGIGFIASCALAVAVGLGARGEMAGPFSVNAHPWGLLYLVIVGFCMGGALITPGMSGSYVLLLTGTYEPVMQALNSLTQPPIHWGTMISMAGGTGLGILAWSKLVDLALRRQPAVTFYAILGLISGSLVGLWPAKIDFSAFFRSGLLALVCGVVIACLAGKLTGNGSLVSSDGRK